MKLQTKFHCEICDKRFNLTSNFKRTRLEFISIMKSIQIKDPYKSTRNPCWQVAFNENSIVQYETKYSIWHKDLKTRLELWSKIHSLEWKSPQGSIVIYATWDSVWQLVLKGQDLNSYQKSILKSSFKEKRKQNSIMRFLTKDPIWHLDLKTKLEFF